MLCQGHCYLTLGLGLGLETLSLESKPVKIKFTKTKLNDNLALFQFCYTTEILQNNSSNILFNLSTVYTPQLRN